MINGSSEQKRMLRLFRTTGGERMTGSGALSWRLLKGQKKMHSLSVIFLKMIRTEKLKEKKIYQCLV
jgi:hypothetical protein